MHNNAVIQTPVSLPMPPLPADTKKSNEGRRGSLDSNSNQNMKNIPTKKNQKNNLSPSRNQKKNVDSDTNKNSNLNLINGKQQQQSLLNELNKIDGKEENIDDRAKVKIFSGDRNKEEEEGSGEGEAGGYLSHHLQHRKEKVKSKNTNSDNINADKIKKYGDDDSNGNKSGNDNNNDDNTVKSKAYSVNSRNSQNTNNSKRISVGGKSTPGLLITRPQKALSNIQQIKNAINHVCLAGAHYDIQRVEAVRAVESYSVLTDPESTPVTQFLVLFYHSESLSFRGVYAVHPFNGKKK